MAKLIFKAPYYSPVSKTPEGKTRGNYASYIATRDGVEIISRSGMAEYMDARKGSHGMFSDEGVTIDMKKVCDAVDSVDGNVWGVIFSLKREDAERLATILPSSGCSYSAHVEMILQRRCISRREIFVGTRRITITLTIPMCICSCGRTARRKPTLTEMASTTSSKRSPVISFVRKCTASISVRPSTAM